MVEIPLLAHHHRAAPFTPLATLAAQERVTHPLKMLPDIQPTTDDGRRTTDDGRRTTDDGRRTTDDGRHTTADRIMGFWTQYPRVFRITLHSSNTRLKIIVFQTNLSIKRLSEIPLGIESRNPLTSRRSSVVGRRSSVYVREHL